jgi:hypothetical protein
MHKISVRGKKGKNNLRLIGVEWRPIFKFILQKWGTVV